MGQEVGFGMILKIDFDYFCHENYHNKSLYNMVYFFSSKSIEALADRELIEVSE